MKTDKSPVRSKEFLDFCHGLLEGKKQRRLMYAKLPMEKKMVLIRKLMKESIQVVGVK